MFCCCAAEAALILAASEGLPWGPYCVSVCAAYLFLIVLFPAEKKDMRFRRWA